MEEEDYNDDNESASGVYVDITKYLQDKFPKDGDDLDGDADPGFKDWLNDKFNI